MRWIQNISWREAAFTLMILLTAAYLMVYGLGKSDLLRDGPSHTSVLVLLDGSGDKPYIYRLLVPALGKVFAEITPVGMQEELTAMLSQWRQWKVAQDFINGAKWRGFSSRLADPAFAYPVLVIVLMMYGALVAYGFTLHRISELAFPHSKYMPMCTAIFGLFILLPFITGFFKVYDPTTLLFSALCLLFLQQQRWNAYLITFAVACLNKESILLYTGFFAMAFVSRLPHRQFVVLLITQVAIWVLIKMGVNLWYADYPGQIMKYRPVFVWSVLTRNFTAVNLIIPIVVYGLLIARWKEVPHTLRHSVWLLPACGLIYYFLGFPYEYRVFFDCFPGLTVIAGYTLFRPLDDARKQVT